MGTNKVTKSLRHNENLFNLPLERKNRTFPFAFTLFKFFSSMWIRSASKLAAIAASAAQVKGQSWRSCSRLLTEVGMIN